MKKHLTTLEEKAHELWPTFDHQNPEAFWQKYEALLDQHKTQEAKISSTNQATVILPQIYPKTIFHPDALYLFGKLLTLSFPLLFVWGGVHQAADSFTIGQMTSVLLMSAIGWVIFTFFSATSICSFELTEHHLIIRNALFIVNKKVLWRRIQSIQVQKNNDPEEHTSYELVITDLIGFKQRFAYTLSAKNHQQLYQALSKRVTQIDAEGYQGYLG